LITVKFGVKQQVIYYFREIVKEKFSTYFKAGVPYCNPGLSVLDTKSQNIPEVGFVRR
jgi:hypothetical protein